MKNIIILFLAVVLLSAKQSSTTLLQTQGNAYDLSDALEKGLITAEVTGNSESPHYVKPLNIILTNIKNVAITLEVANGQQFASNDSELQDIILIKEELIALKAGETKTISLFGMCTQQSNRGPGSEDTYTIGEKAVGYLAALTKEIEKREAFNTLGQYAVWSITDDKHLNSISGFDKDEALYLKTYVANLLNVPVPEYDPDDYMTNYTNDGLIKRSATGNFKFTFTEDSAVTIAMFDEENIVVRELYNNPTVPKGYHELEFKFDVSVYQNQAYYVRMIVDGEIKIDMKMKPRGS